LRPEQRKAKEGCCVISKTAEGGRGKTVLAVAAEDGIALFLEPHEKADDQDIENVKDEEGENIKDQQDSEGDDDTNNDDVGYMRQPIEGADHENNKSTQENKVLEGRDVSGEESCEVFSVTP
nr:hypothetical protein [Tanacetum cinerariifolium]